MASAPEARRVSREWPVWMTVVPGERPVIEIVRALKETGGLRATKWMAEFLGALLKVPASNQLAPANLARIALAEIDFFENGDRATFGHAIMRGAEYGLSVFSLEVALLARLGYSTQPKGESLMLATPMEDNDRAPCAFHLVNDTISGVAIEPLYVMPERRFSPATEFIFKIP